VPLTRKKGTPLESNVGFLVLLPNVASRDLVAAWAARRERPKMDFRIGDWPTRLRGAPRRNLPAFNEAVRALGASSQHGDKGVWSTCPFAGPESGARAQSLRKNHLGQS